MSRSTLPPDTRIGTVHLRVSDLDAQVAFYEDALGFFRLAEDGVTAALGTAGGRAPLLVLHGAPGAPPPTPGTPGLFHVAFRVPTRADLGAMILRIRASGASIDGFADHNVSEAVYLTDPEGNGIELYVDRAQEVWHSVDGEIFMITEPLNVAGLLLAASAPATRLPSGSVVGHIHLRVGTLEKAEAFYVDRLGFAVTNRTFPGALFVSAGGYHHHVGLNVWGGEGAAPSEGGALGLVSFDVIVPSSTARRRILGGEDEGSLWDPDNVRIRIVPG